MKKLIVLFVLCLSIVSGLYADTLVAYFSQTGEAEELAIKVADVLNADIFPIIPSLAYTEEDLNKKDNFSRYSFEASHKSSRPSFEYQIDVTGYDTVVLVYPIWYGRAPNIMCTFLESVRLEGKRVIPIVLGTKSVNRSGNKLEDLLSKDVIFYKAKGFVKEVSDEEILAYFNSLY
ncbi:MAG: flavodoxin [Sphaerochaetaceae bacterium]|nr:flavodoxin [Sphaerochaetaceae bacterium]